MDKKLILTLLVFVAALLVFSITGCSTAGNNEALNQGQDNAGEEVKAEAPPETPKTDESFVLSSGAFENEGTIPDKYCMHQIQGGKNISPPLSWTDPPAGTKSFALFCIDTHSIANNWIHWAVINIPVNWRNIEEGASGTEKMDGALELKNSFGFPGWGGPMPPVGTGTHNYEFHLLALPYEKVDLAAAKSSPFELFKKLQQDALKEAILVGIYKR